MKSIALHFFSIIALLCISTSPIVTYMAISPNWYHFNYQYQRVTKKISTDLVAKQTNNLTRFFLHQEKLNTQWKAHEQRHMQDVRTILYAFMIISLMALVFLILLPWFSPNNALRTLRNASGLLILLFILISIPIISWFPFFWSHIFHPLFFAKDTWIYQTGDISYYLFPMYFFIRSSFLLAAFCLSSNLLILVISSLCLLCKQKSVSTHN